MAIRIYAVHAGDVFRLVEATSKLAALRYVAKDFINIEVADQRTLVAAMQEGIRVERTNFHYEK